MRRRVVVIAFGAAWFATAPVLAQPGDSARPSFEVASVKARVGNDGPRGISFSPSGRFAWSRMTLQQLMQSAFAELQFKQIAGGPGWTTSDTIRHRCDIGRRAR